MKITKITRQQRRTERYSIYIDGKYAFSLSEVQLADSGLVTGQELSDEKVSEYKKESSQGKKYDRLLKWLTIRPRSEWEIDAYIDRLCQKDKTGVADLKDRVARLGQVNDREFARAWVENRRLLRTTSKRKLHQELRQKRVPRDIIDDTLADDETDEITVLKNLIEKKRRQAQYNNPQKLMAFLARQGFRYGDIRTAFDEMGIDLYRNDD